ncbi:hypothetical protein TNCV_1401471 [Trichonephila clavipes]|nr:hypothetical protein TNCV_1401471 [Trichonephila clavipes]
MGRDALKSVEAQASSCWCGVEVRRRSTSSGVIRVSTKITRSVAKSPRVADSATLIVNQSPRHQSMSRV